MNLKHRLLLISSSLLFGLTIAPGAYGQPLNDKCVKLWQGHFYAYSNTSWAEIFRDETYQIEVNRKTNDTMINRIKWLTPCSFSFDYVSSTVKYEPGEEDFHKSFKTIVEIMYVGKDFYTYKAKMNSSMYSKELVVEDTIWTKRIPRKEGKKR
jgi:hypothetical protein